MDIRQLFALNLRKLRREAGLSQENLAHDAGIDRAYISRVERGVTYVGLEIVEKLTKVLGIDTRQFFDPPERQRRSKVK